MHAEGRRRRPLVLRDVRRYRRPADARAAAAAGELLRRRSRSTTPARRRRAATATLTADGEAVQDDGRPRLHRQARRARPGDCCPAPSARTRQVIRRALSAFAVLCLLAGCGGAAGEGEGTAQLWVTRDRGATLLVDTKVDGRADADARARVEGGRQDSLRRPLRPGGERNRRQPQRAARLVLVRQRLSRATAARPRTGSTTATWPGLTTAPGSGMGRRAVVVGAFPEPFLHGYAGKTRPVAVRYDRRSEQEARKLGAELGARRGRTARDACAGGSERARGARRYVEPHCASCSARPPATRCASSGAAIRRRRGRYSVP